MVRAGSLVWPWSGGGSAQRVWAGEFGKLMVQALKWGWLMSGPDELGMCNHEEGEEPISALLPAGSERAGERSGGRGGYAREVPGQGQHVEDAAICGGPRVGPYIQHVEGAKGPIVE